jgi:hypothetical protein
VLLQQVSQRWPGGRSHVARRPARISSVCRVSGSMCPSSPHVVIDATPCRRGSPTRQAT